MSRVVIIGGGIAGVSAAAALAVDGHEVILFEAETQLGYHASGRSAAVFEENYGNATVRALNHATAPVLTSIDALSARGILLVAGADQEREFRRDLAELDISEISVEAARERVPILSDAVTFVAQHAGAMDVDTDAVLQHFAKTARTHGARIETGAAVEAIRSGWDVRAGGVEIAAEIVVDAAGAWADDVAGMAGVSTIGLQPFRRSMARLPAPGGHDVRNWPMLLGAGESWYAKPDAGGWIVSPAEEEAVLPMDAWADDMVLAEGIARYEAFVTEPVTRVETSWAGLRTFAPDRSLVIGEDPGATGFFWLAGQGGYGFQTCAGAAEHLSALIAGRQSRLGPDVTRALSPARFRDGQAKLGV